MSDQNDKPEGRTVTGVVPPKDEILSMVGEGIHTGLRKGTDAESSGPMWQAIANSSDGGWSEALDWFLWGLRYSGWEIVRVTDG